MECRLRQAGRTDVHVLNGGMSAYTSAHTLVRLQFDVLAYQPDLVIVMENINDLTIPYRAALSGEAVDQNYLVRYGRKEMTGAVDQDDVVPIRVLRALRNRLRPEPPRQPLSVPVDVTPGAALFERNLASIAGIAAVHGVPLVLLTMPMADSDSLYQYTRSGFNQGAVTVGPLPADYGAFQADFERYNRGVEKVGAENGVAVIRMHALMDRSSANFADLVHFTTAGTLRFGEIMAESVLPLLPANSEPLAPFHSGDSACGWDSKPTQVTHHP
jgi:lysophospholipase L1-like esterase